MRDMELFMVFWTKEGLKSLKNGYFFFVRFLIPDSPSMHILIVLRDIAFFSFSDVSERV